MSYWDFGSWGGFAAFAFTVFLIVLALLWALLPFVVFKMREQLAEIGRGQRRTNELLAEIARQRTP